MKFSFITLSISIALLFTTRLLNGFFSVPGFLGLQLPVSQYLFTLLYLIFYSSLFLFSLNIYKKIDDVEGNVKEISSRTIAGIAVSSLLSFIFAGAMSVKYDSLHIYMAIYFSFVLACGLIIVTPDKTPIKTIAKYSAWPAFTFLISSLGILYIVHLLNEDLGGLSGGLTNDTNSQIVITVILSVVAVPIISAAILGRDMIIDLILKFANLPHDSLVNLKKNIKILLSIIALLVSAFFGYSIFEGNGS